MDKGKFIVFEGLDGSGTTTQSRLLKEWFENENQPVYLTHEPTEGPIGILIRLALAGRLCSATNNQTYQQVNESTLALFFAADRMDHLQNTIIPNLEKGINVICDRYYLSSFAYQSLELEFEWIKQINSKCRQPDLTFMLDVPVIECKKRMAKERWHIDLYEDEEKLEKVRVNYLRIIEEYLRRKENIEILNGNLSQKDVHNEVEKKVRKFLTSGKNIVKGFKGSGFRVQG